MKRWIAWTTGAVAVIAIALLILMSAKYEGDAAVRINIPKGATKEAVRDSMQVALGDSYGRMVYNLWYLAAGDPAASHGSYRIDPGESALKTAHKIKAGNETPIRVTLNNMRTIDDLAKKLGNKLEASQADIKKSLQKVLADNPDFGGPAEFAAAFLPDTYEFYWTDEPDLVIDHLVRERDSFWNEDRLAKAKKLGLTPVQVATIASIVEEESNKKDEHPMIARLYMNRLDQGMKLQADPTVKYAVGDFSLRRITGKHLKIDSPYNTYKNTGLPPGPIRIPQKSTIDAVLNAPQHSYIYMCAKEDFSGRHNFATNYAQHKANARKYQAALNRRGIR